MMYLNAEVVPKMKSDKTNGKQCVYPRQASYLFAVGK